MFSNFIVHTLFDNEKYSDAWKIDCVINVLPVFGKKWQKSGEINKPKNSKENVGIQLLTFTGIESDLILKSLMKVGLKNYILIHGGLKSNSVLKNVEKVICLPGASGA